MDQRRGKTGGTPQEEREEKSAQQGIENPEKKEHEEMKVSLGDSEPPGSLVQGPGRVMTYGGIDV